MLITKQDFFDLGLKILKKRNVSQFLNFFILSDKNKIRNKWNNSKGNLNFWDFYKFDEIWNEDITGSKDIRFREFIVDTFLGENQNVLSVGCGDGNSELEYSNSRKINKIIGIDISIERILRARGKVENNSKVTYECTDFFKFPTTEQFDVIIFENSFHHLFPVNEVVKVIKLLLKPKGKLILIDYFGPNRFYWEDNQLEEANKILKKIPMVLRKISGTSVIKKSIGRPGFLRMYLSDPSEAAESSIIQKTLISDFKIIIEKNLTGTLLQLVFKDIVDHFNNNEHEAVLMDCINYERNLLNHGKINSDFKFVLYEKI